MKLKQDNDLLVISLRNESQKRFSMFTEYSEKEDQLMSEKLALEEYKKDLIKKEKQMMAAFAEISRSSPE